MGTDNVRVNQRKYWSVLTHVHYIKLKSCHDETCSTTAYGFDLGYVRSQSERTITVIRVMWSQEFLKISGPWSGLHCQEKHMYPLLVCGDGGCVCVKITGLG